MNEFGRILLKRLDEAFDACVANWKVLAILAVSSTFLLFALMLFFGVPTDIVKVAAKIVVPIELVATVVIMILNGMYREQLVQWQHAADAIEARIWDDDAFGDWDEFIGKPAEDKEVERIRQRCLRAPDVFPAETPSAYCGAEGLDLMKGYVTLLRSGLASRGLRGCSAWWRAVRKAKAAKAAKTVEQTPAGTG